MNLFGKTVFALFFAILINLLFIAPVNAASYSFDIKNYTEEKPLIKIPSEVEELVIKQKKINSLTHLLTLRVPILMYHYVEYVKDEKDTTRISLNTLPHVLEAQIQTLKDAGFTFLTNKQLSEFISGIGFLPEKPVVITFDDGYRDFYTDAYPILKKHNTPATQYVVSGLLRDPNYMTPDQVSEIAKDGLVEIAAHTKTHPWLKDAEAKFVKSEVEESKKDLEKLTGYEIVSFAYPYGSFDVQSIEAVKHAGYTSAVSTIPGIMHNHDTKYFLYRLRPGKRVGEELIHWINGSKFTAF